LHCATWIMCHIEAAISRLSPARSSTFVVAQTESLSRRPSAQPPIESNR
jgi:hypothetical protein